MATLILLSGFDNAGFFETFSIELRRTITDISNLLFIASTPDDYKKTDEYARVQLAYLKKNKT